MAFEEVPVSCMVVKLTAIYEGEKSKFRPSFITLLAS
jgi:hypothetical protein